MASVPQLQRYQRQARPSGEKLSPLRIDAPDTTAVASASQQAGQMLMRIGEQQLIEHDTAVAGQAYNTFRQEARERFQQALQLKGSEAQGAMEAYHVWYDTRADEVRGNLRQGNQQQFFDAKAVPSREGDLDALARHQAQQHMEHLKSVLAGALSTAEAEVRIKPFDEMVLRQQLTGIEAEYRKVYKGQDITAVMAESEMKIKVAALQSWVDTDPVRAAELLKEWRVSLGDSYEPLKGAILPRAFYVEAQAANPGKPGQDPKEAMQAQYEWLETTGKIKDEGVRAAAQRLVTADIQHEEYKKGIREEKTVEDWFQRWQYGKLTESDVMTSDLDASTKANWIGKIQAQQDRALSLYDRNDRKARQAATDKSNITYADWSQKVALTPDEVTPADIYNAVDPTGGGLTGPQAEHLVGTWRQGQERKKAAAKATETAEQKKMAEAEKRARERIKQMHARGDFGPTAGSDTDADKTMADMILGLEEFVAVNPGKDPNEWLDRKREDMAQAELETRVNGLFDRFLDLSPVNQSTRERIELWDKQG